MKHFALRLLVATLTFSFGLTCTSQYRAFVVQRRHNQMMARELQLKKELFQKRATEIESLLNKPLPVEVPEGDHIRIQIPNPETRQIRNRLLEVANESSQSRSQVIEALIRVLEKQPEYLGPFAERWTTAVYLLGDLKATEAIDILGKNLDQTGENLPISMNYLPASSAMVEIGEPAVPRLIEALGDNNPGIRLQAEHALARIGQPAVAKLEEVLHNGSAETKGEAALVLVWILGPEAKATIDRAIELETDQEALSKLNDALKEWHRHWGR